MIRRDSFIMSSALSSTYHLICWIATVSFSIFWIYEYSLNEDLVSIDFKNYHESKTDVSPMLSFCLLNPFSDKKLRMITPEINSSTYLKFLRGEELNSTWLDIGYQSIIKNVSEYVERDRIRFRNGSLIYIHPDDPHYNDSETHKYKGFNESLGRYRSIALFFNYRFYNCYGLSIPQDKELQDIMFRVKSSVFPSGIRQQMHSLMTIIHYPDQMLYSMHTSKYSWPKTREKRESYIMRFKISTVEVVRRRQKQNFQCNENWKNFDNEVLKSHVKSAGCQPIYLSSSFEENYAPICTTKEQIKKATFALRSDGYGILPPCRSMEQISYSFDESTIDPKKWNWGKEETFFIKIALLNSRFKDVYQTRYEQK